MHRLLKKLLTYILVFILIFSCLPISAFAAENDFVFIQDGSEITISGYNGSDTEIEIPSTHDGLPVTKIAQNAFAGLSELTKILLPDSIYYIETGAVNNCTKLSRIFILGDQPTIESDAFLNVSAEFKINYHVSNSESWQDYSAYPKQAFCNNTIDLNDGSAAIKGYTDINDGVMEQPAIPQRDGFVFKGWYLEPECTTLWQNENITSDVTLYAKWNETFAVTFNTMGGSELDTVSVESGETIDEPTSPAKEGYTFGGWFKEDTCENEWNFDSDIVSAQIKLYAKWNQALTVTFDSMGGSEIDAMSVEPGMTIEKPASPSKIGYAFGGWYKENTCENVWDLNTDSVTTDITLFAKWIENGTPFSGSGTEENPYGISTPEQLNAVRDYPNANFIMLNDIDMSEATSEGGAYWNGGNGWISLCPSSSPFVGSFDGNNKRISGLKVLFNYIGRYEEAGMLGYVFDLNITGILTNVNNGIIENIDASEKIAATNNGTIENACTSGNLSGGSTGGIVNVNNGLISNCENGINIDSTYNAAGIAETNRGTISCCYNTGDIQGDMGSGGIVNVNYGHIKNCFNIGYVYDTRGVGGLAKENTGTIMNCYNLGGLYSDQPGGIVKTNTGTVRNCFWLDTVSTGVVTGNSTVFNSHALCVDNLTEVSSFSGFDFNAVWTMSGDGSYPFPMLTGNPLSLAENNSEFAGGRGLPTDPYRISTPTQLNNVRNHMGSWFRLVNDIDMTGPTHEGGEFYNGGTGWIPLGNYYLHFLGGLDGNGYCIKGLYIKSSEDYWDIGAGLFGVLGSSARIRNLGMVNSDIEASKISAGGISGFNYGSIYECYNDGSVKAAYAGGIAGSNSGSIINCYNTGTVTGGGVGGISAKNYGLVQYSYNAGTVVSNYTGAGAIVYESHGTVKDCRYFNTSVCGVANGTGTVSNVFGITEEQMRYAGYFSGFNFNSVWTMSGEADYPYPELLANPAKVSPENLVDFEGGNGYPFSPYQISTAEQLNCIRNYPNRFFILKNDINLSAATQASGAYYNGGKGWDPIENFMGGLDGNYHTITGLTVNRTDQANVGLFEKTLYGSSYVQNLNLTNIHVAGKEYIGGLIGDSGSSIVNVFVSGIVADSGTGSGFACVGGLTGKSTGKITLCRNECTVSGYTAGGIAGLSYGTIKTSCNAGMVGGISACGGITGENRCDIYDCYNKGEIKRIKGSSGCGIGGIAGDIMAGNFHECYNVGNVHDDLGGTIVGGILGECVYATPSITNCYYINTNTKGIGYGTFTGTVSKSDAELRQQVTYSGYDFNSTWAIGQTGYEYPILSEMGNTNFTVAFDLNGQAGTAPEVQMLNAGEKITKPEDPILAGYTFRGWYKEPACIVPWNFEYNTVNSNITLYAKWTLNQCIVTFNSCLGSDVVTQTLLYGEKILKPDDPIRTGFIFKGWYREQVYSHAWDFNLYTVTSDITLYAMWDEDIVPFTGSGTTEDPYGISTPGQLNRVRDYADASFVLLNDIDMTEATTEGGEYYNSGLGWAPLAPFSGTFDGAGHKIIGLKINRTTEGYIGLFDQISSGGVVLRLGMVDCDIYGGHDGTGSICARNYGTIKLCYNTGKVAGTTGSTGGISGVVFSSGKIYQCYNSGIINENRTSVSSATSSGGIAGSIFASGIAISDCYNIGIVKVGGGIVGLGNFAIRNCYSLRESGHAIIGYYAGYLDASGLYFFKTSSYKTGAVNVSDGTEYATALTNEQMQIEESFAEFDFDTVWTMQGNASYPYPELIGLSQESPPENNTEFAGGNGFPFSPFIVSTPEQLNNVRDYTWGCFELVNDIDMTQATSEGGAYYNGGQGFAPILFSGVFNGNDFDIKGLKSNRGSSPAGLFIAGCSSIIDLGVIGADIRGSDAGGIAASGSGTEFIGCHFSGSVAGDNAGGIAGRSSSCGIFYCKNNADITGFLAAGGIAGDNQRGEIGMCFNTGTIESNYDEGGIAGNNGFGLIADCYNTGIVIDGAGIVGDTSYSSSITRCYNVGIVLIPIAPFNHSSSIKNCYYRNNGGTVVTGATAVIDEQLCQQDTYSEFDFSEVWTMAGEENYPYAELQGLPHDNLPQSGVAFEGGTGTQADPYQISSAEQLNEVRNYPYNHFILLNDIDLSAATSEGGIFNNDGSGWEPIGSNTKPFMGMFDGKGKKISGLVINRPYNSDGACIYTGLFGVLDWGAQIKNLRLTAASITGSGTSGGIVGNVNTGATVENCSFEGFVCGTKTNDNLYVGGIAGNCNGTINSCYNAGTIKSTGYSGGISGRTYGNVSNCYNTGYIQGTLSSGGISGSSSHSNFTYCYNIGNIYSGKGLVGYDDGNNTTNHCYFTEDELSGIAAAGIGEHVEAKNVDLLQQQVSFVGFDFDTIWTMGGNVSYPCPELRVVPQADIPENTTDYSGGNGLVYNPYRISTPQNLYHVRENLSSWYILNCDIDLSQAVGEEGDYYNAGMGWQPIGDQNSPFIGRFDGKDYTVSGLFISRTQSDYIGLFGYTGWNARITDLNVEANISAKNYAGAITGYNKGEITDCTSSGVVTGVSYTGGITGLNYKNISRCSNAASIIAKSNAGGICGRNGINNDLVHSVIIDSNNKGSISGDQLIGGIAGDNMYSSISTCFNIGSSVTFVNYSGGGIAGSNYYGTIDRCYNTAKVSSSLVNGSIGGIAGKTYAGNVTNCFNAGLISSSTKGTIVGAMYYNAVIRYCYSLCPNTYSPNISNQDNGLISGYYFLYEGSQDLGPQAKTRAQMCSQTTFQNYDFVNTWEIADNRFPILKGVPYTYVDNIGISSNSADMHIGDTVTLTADIGPDDATNNRVVWYSSNTSVATVSGGIVRATGGGTAVITAESQDGGFTDTCRVTVTQPLTSISLDKHTLGIRNDNSSSLHASFTPTDATNKNVTWSSSNDAVAIVDQNGQVTAVSKGTADITVTAEDGGYTDTCKVTVIQPVDKVELGSTSGSIPSSIIVGDTLRLTATVSPSDASYPTVRWSSSKTSVATVDLYGRVTAVAPGSATITATADGVSDTCEITVEKKAVNSITLDCTSGTIPSSLAVGTSATLTATVSPSDATYPNITWSSSKTSVATVDQSGKVTAVSPGTAMITATADGVSNTCEITVEKKAVSSIALNHSSSSLVAGNTLSLTATVSPSDATYKTVTWSSDDTSVAIVDQSGNVVAGAPGNATITAIADGKSALCILTVYSSQVTVTASVDNPSFGYVSGGGTYSAGQNVILTAYPYPGYRFVRWLKNGMEVSRNSSYTVVASSDMSLVAEFAGLTPIGISCTKTDASIYGSANGSVNVSASGGDSGSFEYSINGGVGWQSSGVFSGLSAGTYTVLVRDAQYPSNAATCQVAIDEPAYVGAVPANKISPKAAVDTAITVTPPAAPKGYATQSVDFATSNPSIATVDANGNVTFLSGGKVTIITKVVSQTVDKKGKVKIKTTTVKKTITVNQLIETISLNLADTTIARTQKVSLAANIAPSTASNKKLTWKSSNPKVAAVSGTGVVTGKAGGIAIITCTAKDGSGASASCVVTVTPIYPTAIKLSKVVLTVKLGKTASLKATITPKNTDFKTVAWTSSNPAVVTVDAKGKLKAMSSGTAIVTVTTSNGLTASCMVTVP